MYQFQAANSGKCLRIAGSAHAAQASCSTSDSAQKFSLVTLAATPRLACSQPTEWEADYSWPAPTTGDLAAYQYSTYVHGKSVTNQADAWWPVLQVQNDGSRPSNTAYYDSLAPESHPVEVSQLLPRNGESLIGTGTVVLGPTTYRTYLCG